jgi:putative nucleotidyltransferase with HDIG domain
LNEISPELSRKLLAAVEKMPAFPGSVQRILELTRDPNCDPKELVAAIEKDPVITMKILRILNSAYYSFPRQITSVNQSVVLLGLNTIKNMALSFAAVGVLPPHNNAAFDIQHYLLHALTTASIARMLCQKYGDDDTDPGDCYIAGLLHDFGKVAFAQYLPEEFRKALELAAREQIPLQLAEQRVIGIDHTVAGAMLAEHWQFPKTLADAIRTHHICAEEASMLQCSLFVANQISKKLEMGNAGNPVVEELPPGIVKRFGADLDGIIASLGDLSKISEEAQNFAQASKVAA